MASLTMATSGAAPTGLPVVVLLVVLGVSAAGGAARRATGAPARAASRRRLAGLRRPSDPRLWPRASTVVRATWARRAGGGQRRRLLVDGLPGLLDDVARGVRAGSSLRQACADATGSHGPAGSGLRAAVAQAERGQALPVAFRAWAAATVVPEERLAAGALALVATTGGPQARAVDGVAATLRDRRAVAGEVRAQSAQARLSALVIGILPLGFLAWVAVTDRRTAAFLLAGPAGWACLLGGLGLEAAGALWMRHLLRGAAP